MSKKKITLVGLILMIFTTIYGFANTTVAYEQMGYASIIWYVLAAILFLLPTAMMFAEYGSTFKDAHGGIYSWLAGSIGEEWAFIGTFIWLSSWI
ncbi:amino acid permease, partial [Lactobacillus parabuchneri]|nr:amino acid permease [Lentilactobacillus parabuchneri]